MVQMLPEKIQLIKFDLIILDIMMPGDDGLTLTQEIRIIQIYLLSC